tara:strand:+ start:1046 stop:1987 length:942 start_codon:yes stop_codon:yes gene_type:complete
LILTSSILFILGCILLYYGSEYLIDHSNLVSKSFNVSPIVIGATIVALGTSLPELLVSIYSILFIDGSDQSSGIIIGNILGSNIANISLVLGYCALIYSIFLKDNLNHDFLFIFILGLYTLLCLKLKITINYIHGLILILSFFYYLFRLIKNNKISNTDKNSNNTNLYYSLVVIFFSIASMLAGSHLVVENATELANIFKINTLTIGITIIALGTSLPELFTGIISVKKKQYNLFIGNIVGSNILNIVFVLGLTSIFSDIKPEVSQNELLYISIAFIVSHLILIISYAFKNKVSKISGFLLVLLYIIFLYNIF